MPFQCYSPLVQFDEYVYDLAELFCHRSKEAKPRTGPAPYPKALGLNDEEQVQKSQLESIVICRTKDWYDPDRD